MIAKRPYSVNTSRLVSVARTMSGSGNTQLSKLLRVLGREYGAQGSVKTLESLHMTILPASLIRPALAREGFTPHDVKEFRAGLVHALHDEGFGATLTAKVDPDAPFGNRAYGKRRHNLLGLNIVPDSHMEKQHGIIMDYVQETLGVEPVELTELHITLGALYGDLARGIRRSPSTVIPEHAVVPQHVKLNGIDAYIGRISI